MLTHTYLHSSLIIEMSNVCELLTLTQLAKILGFKTFF